MINLNLVALAVLTLSLVIILVFCYLDVKKKRILKKHPLISVVIPYFNDGETIEKTIKSIYDSYDKFEIIVIDDSSNDNSCDRIKRLKEKFDFRLICNRRNLGKARTLNKYYKLARYETILFLDADVLLNKIAINDLLARLNPKDVVAVSAPYKPKNKGFLALMQEIEYNMLALLQGSYNRFSAISLWGGCFVIKKSIFREAGGFCNEAITEDIDLALRLREKGHKIEQSFCKVETYVPDTLNIWYKQKIRWASGGAQNMIKHFKVWIKNPLHLIFTLLFLTLNLIFVFQFIKEISMFENIIYTLFLIPKATVFILNFELIGLYYGAIFLKNIISNIYFMFFSLPYVIPLIKRSFEAWKILFVLLFSLVYMPMYTFVSFMGLLVGFYRYLGLSKGKRAW